jgi:hypothetical protein
MARLLSEVLQYASQFIRLAPLTGFASTPSGGRTGDPALSIGDWVRQTILSPPFSWRWNRSTTTIATVAGTQDYASIISTNFGWLEKATVTATGVSRELEIALVLGEESTQNLPAKIAPQSDDGTTITFRLSPPPEKVYSLKLTWQLQSPSFGTVADTWAPLPDYMFHIYSQGFLARAYEYLGDDRAPFAMNMFLKQLVSFHGGLTESQLNLFLDQRLITQVRPQDAQLRNQQTVSSRGLQ